MHYKAKLVSDSLPSCRYIGNLCAALRKTVFILRRTLEFELTGSPGNHCRSPWLSSPREDSTTVRAGSHTAAGSGPGLPPRAPGWGQGECGWSGAECSILPDIFLRCPSHTSRDNNACTRVPVKPASWLVCWLWSRYQGRRIHWLIHSFMWPCMWVCSLLKCLIHIQPGIILVVGTWPNCQS